MLRIPLFVLLLAAVAQPVAGQTAAPDSVAAAATDYAWKPLLTHEGVAFDYIYYQGRGGAPDGLVIRLHNANGHAVRYRFDVVMRGTRDEVTGNAEGTLPAGTYRTGDQDGLYWVPFDDQPLVSVGLRRLRVAPAQGQEAHGASR